MPPRRVMVWLAPLLVGSVGLALVDVANLVGPGGWLTNGLVTLPAGVVFHGGLYAAWAALWWLAGMGLGRSA